MKLPNWDPPQEIVQGILRAQERILTGYKDHPKTDPQMLREAALPRHVAISLTGEPTLYEPLSELLSTLHTNGMTTFLVSNGSLPDKLSRLSTEPTQLYISASAPDKKTFEKVCRPRLPYAWDRLNETLRLLPNFKCPTVIRSTLVKGLNMENCEGYAKLLARAKPTYIEAKAYMHIGFSGLRLDFDYMPSHEEVYDFALRLSERTGYKIIDEAPDSRVVLLSKLDKPIRFSSD